MSTAASSLHEHTSSIRTDERAFESHDDEDALSAAKAIVLGLVVSTAMWAALALVLFVF
jgi:hypothetical protein